MTMYFLEKTNKDDTYTRIYESCSYDACLQKLNSLETSDRVGLWCNEWVDTDFGYEPMAWIN